MAICIGDSHRGSALVPLFVCSKLWTRANWLKRKGQN